MRYHWHNHSGSMYVEEWIVTRGDFASSPEFRQSLVYASGEGLSLGKEVSLEET